MGLGIGFEMSREASRAPHSKVGPSSWGLGKDQPLAEVWETSAPGPMQQVGKEWRTLIDSSNFPFKVVDF